MPFKLRMVNSNLEMTTYTVLEGALERRLHERGCFLTRECDENHVVSVSIASELNQEAYTIVTDRKETLIKGQNACAVFAGMGAFLSAGVFDGNGQFVPSLGTISFTPEKPLRGTYLATHFFNFYHVAPMNEVYEVLEDLALRGGNALAVWYDMHHFHDIRQPDSQEMIQRLKSILAYARNIGMFTCMTMIANEAFIGTPEAIKAQWHIQGNYIKELDGHYHIEICPSKEGAIEEIMRQRRLVLEAFAEVNPSYIICWPYDQGGCTCDDCSPWGTNGFFKLLPAFRTLVKECMPESKIIVSAWYFDLFIKGEWEGFCKRIEAGELDWTDYVMGFFPQGEIPECVKGKGLPKGIPMVSFPEISMYGGFPWSGFGASPTVEFLDETNKKSDHLYQGGFSYSEGIYEDINKWIMLSYYSGKHKNAEDAVREYVKFEFCTEHIELITEAICLMQKTRMRQRIVGETQYRYVIDHPEYIEEIYERVQKADSLLAENIRKNWRWRIVYLRGMIDYTLYKNDYLPSVECERYYEELNHIYHAQKAYYVVSAPTVDVVNRHLGGKFSNQGVMTAQ